MKNIIKIIAAIITVIIIVFGMTHFYRADGIVSAITYNNFENEVFIDLENGHRYSFYEDGTDGLYEVGYDVNVLMYNNGTDDPTDDIKLF